MVSHVALCSQCRKQLSRYAGPRNRRAERAPKYERRLRTDTATMNVAELRGYVRARAVSVVNAQARRLIAQRRWQSAQVDELIAAALERTVHLVRSCAHLIRAASRAWQCPHPTRATSRCRLVATIRVRGSRAASPSSDRAAEAAARSGNTLPGTWRPSPSCTRGRRSRPTRCSCSSCPHRGRRSLAL